MAAYSMDLRLRVLRDAAAGMPSDDLADNLGAHKVAGVRGAIERAGATLWCPAALPSRPESHRDALAIPRGVSAALQLP